MQFGPFTFYGVPNSGVIEKMENHQWCLKFSEKNYGTASFLYKGINKAHGSLENTFLCT